MTQKSILSLHRKISKKPKTKYNQIKYNIMKKLILSLVAVMVMSRLLLIAIGSNMTIEIYSTMATFLGAFIVGFTIVALYKITKYIKICLS